MTPPEVKKPEKPLIAIVGPTAVGKTEASLRLAERFQGEIVSADSRLFYRGMDIGTAKPTPEERRRVPHHLVDITTPDRPLSLAEFLRLAYQAIDNILARGKVPFVVGGTGQYIWALLEGWQVPEVPPDPKLRARLEAEARTHGPEALYRRLITLDPEAASFIDPRNVRRVIRALEVIAHTGKPFSAQRRKRPPPYDVLILGLTRPRPDLYRRIDRRIEQMVAQGLVDEVRQLLEAGYDESLPAMTSIGYRQLIGYLKGQYDLQEAIRRLRQDTRRYARHQYAWFRLTDPRIRWVDVNQPDALDRLIRLVADFLAGKIPPVPFPLQEGPKDPTT